MADERDFFEKSPADNPDLVCSFKTQLPTGVAITAVNSATLIPADEVTVVGSPAVDTEDDQRAVVQVEGGNVDGGSDEKGAYILRVKVTTDHQGVGGEYVTYTRDFPLYVRNL